MPEADTARKRATLQKRAQTARATTDHHVARTPTSYHDATTIHGRIRKWQTQDVTEAIDPDVLSVRSQPRSEACRTPLQIHSSGAEQAKQKEVHSTPRRRSTKWVQQENKNWVKQRRSVRQGAGLSPKRTPPRAEPAVESVVKEKTPTSAHVPSESQRTRNINSSRAEREERRRRRRETRARANGGTALVDDGIRVYMKSRSHFGSEPGGSTPARSVRDDEPETEHVQDDFSQFKTQLSFTHDGPLPSEHDDQINEDGSPKQPSKYAQTLGKPSDSPGKPEPSRSRKRTILNKTKEILTGGNDSSEAPSNRIPSIRAWLDEQPDMPDPFVDNQHKTPSPRRDAPEPAKHRSDRQKPPTEPAVMKVEDPNKIWDSLNSVQQREARRASRREQRNVSSRQERDSETSQPKRRLFSFEVCDEPNKGENHTAPPPDYAEPQKGSPPNTKRSVPRASKASSAAANNAARPLEQLTPSALNRENSIQPERDITPLKRKPVPRPSDEAIAEFTELDHGNAAQGPDRQPAKQLKRKLTTHEDLLSVLSQPRASRSTRSLHSTRNAEGPARETIIQEVLSTMRQEELKYTRELRTLVDGVTPVLLQSLLSKADATATVGIFGENKNDNTSFTRPIIDMGVALQRLKNMHGRLPLQENNIDGLLNWAVTAHKSYSDYVKSWRLGFQGVIVNLAPLDPSQITEEELLSRDIDGDVLDDQGQKADVAYLQKRPLVRIKRMAKLFTTIRDASPGHQKAVNVAELYSALTEAAKQRHSEEQGRLEDEAAANIDTTRARNMKTMAPLETVEVDKKRKVRARDNFNMSLYHSNGQRLDCRIEIVLRDDPAPGTGGDVLICQVEEEAKWLLFQPTHLSKISARRDQSSSDLVVMVKGVTGIAQGWHELLALRAEDPAAATEWLHMLGSNPLPPRLNHNPSWNMPADPPTPPKVQPGPRGVVPQVPAVPKTPLNASALANLPSDIDIPIGEPSVILRRRPKAKTESTAKTECTNSEQRQTERAPQLSMGGGLQHKNLPEGYQHMSGLPQLRQYKASQQPTEQLAASSDTKGIPVRSYDAPRASRSSGQPSVQQLKRPTPDRQVPLVPRPRYSPQKIAQPNCRSTITSPDTNIAGSELTSPRASEVQAETDKLFHAIETAQYSWEQEPPLMSGGLSSDDGTGTRIERPRTRDDTLQRDVDSENEIRRPPVARPGKHSRVRSFSSTPLTDTIKEQWSVFSGLRKKQQSTPNTPERRPTSPELASEDLPGLPPAAARDHSLLASPVGEERPPLPPAHRSAVSLSSGPHQSTTSLPQSPRHRSWQQPELKSPLKQEYRGSSSDESSSDADSDDTDATSEMSEDDLNSELKDQATPLVRVGQGNRRSSFGPARPLPSIPSAGTKTLDPSDSASNGPYRRAPPPSSFPASKKKRTIAMVCSWSDRGVWEPIREDECSIVISPGLVQAFPMSAAHSQPIAGADWEEVDDERSSNFAGQQPLVEFELTPVVPLRKGTALDITIRSPPTPNSTVRTTNNVMFRSRTVQECEKLYQLINWARCNNPTYAQLARSRSCQPTVTFAADVPQSKSRSWFSFGSREKSSYRASSRPPTSIADSAASGASTNSAFSALRKFGENSPFSLKRSSVMRRRGLASANGSLYSSSNGGSGSGTSTPVPASQTGFIPGPDGPNVPATSAEAANGGGMVNNMKIRLFVRKGAKWEALGQSLLTVLPAAVSGSSPDSRPGSSGASTPPQSISRAPSSMQQPRASHLRLPSSSTTPHRIHGDGREKRILITTAKNKNVVLLDEILGESCFEKVMQTGIAVNVWKEDEVINEYGGVMTGRSRMYMIQFKTSTEASWVFNMCGTYRYGSGGQP